jgi:hypothetical protein
MNGARPACPDPGLNIPELTELIAVGGWPGHLRLTAQQALRANRDYLEETRRVDRSGPVRLDSSQGFLSGFSAESYAASLTVGSITA